MKRIDVTEFVNLSTSFWHGEHGTQRYGQYLLNEIMKKYPKTYSEVRGQNPDKIQELFYAIDVADANRIAIELFV